MKKDESNIGNKREAKCRVLLLAPTTIVGGITTWTRYLKKYSNAQRISYRIIDTSRRYAVLGQKLGLVGKVRGAMDALIRCINIFYAVVRFRPHVAYFTCAPSLGLVFRDAPIMLMLSLLRMPTIAHLRGGNVNGFLYPGRLQRLVVRSAFRKCKWVIIITREMQEAAKRVLGSKNVIYLPNMIDDNKVAAYSYHTCEKSTLNLLHVAWQAPEKGSLDLVDAVRYVQAPVGCDLVGQAAPENRELIQNRIETYGVSDKIRLVGIKRDSDLEKAFEEADIFVLPTHKEGPEGFPNVILEAMSYGLPIIANDVGNIREMIGFDTAEPAGLLLSQVDPVDCNELAELIDSLASNPELRRKLSRNGFDRVKRKYTASKVVPELERMLCEIANMPY